MPLRGKEHSAAFKEDAPFFGSLADLDLWLEEPKGKLRGTIGFPDGHVPTDRHGKLLVCHDFKGGYAEVPSDVTYTFNFWNLCDVFVYFSHHRVTIPPSGWTTAAHRQGVKMLGTLIFEHKDSESDCLRLLFGKLPASRTGPASPSSDDSVPASPHYARVLAELADQRGFDGYLLNFEYPMGGGIGQTRALAAWIALLERELKTKVGPHTEVIWYDSIVYTGQLRWQDRLNSYNLPFFVPSTGFFTNYTWPPHFPSVTAQYFLSLDPALLSTTSSRTTPKTLQDVYTGVDVWGRGSHGGGGLGCYRAIQHIDPTSLGLSVALFGQGWTWESQQDKPGWSWDAWWTLERLLWLGPPAHGEAVAVPPAPRREGEPECPHDAFHPLRDFFAGRPPPDPRVLPFCTAFCPGVGWAWFVNGAWVLQTETGWTDIDKQSAIGDLVWPRPELRWEDGARDEALPAAATAFCFDEAWVGGNSLRVAFELAGSPSEDAFFRCFWLPVQSLTVSRGQSYDAHVVFKTPPCGSADLDIGLVLKPANGKPDVLDVSPISAAEDLPNGWTKQSLQFTLTADAAVEDECLAIGLVVGVAAEDPSAAVSFFILLGQMAVYPSAPPAGTLSPSPRILWADFQPAPDAQSLSGVLTWEVAGSFPGAPTPSTIPDADDPNPVWLLDTSDRWAHAFAYFNVYVHEHSAEGYVGGPELATFVGTTGLDGRANRMYIDEEVLPEAVRQAAEVRFYVQGVTDRGEVLPWDRCVFVDTKLQI